MYFRPHKSRIEDFRKYDSGRCREFTCKLETANKFTDFLIFIFEFDTNICTFFECINLGYLPQVHLRNVLSMIIIYNSSVCMQYIDQNCALGRMQ